MTIQYKITQKTFKDTDDGKDIIDCNDKQEMFNKLGI